MVRTFLVLLLCASLTGLRAQKDSSLTKEFERMSAKERARVAKQEDEDAAKDRGFQTAMAEADALFKQQEYDEALEKYQAARRLRPLNVHPKVKIQDLQALIKKRDEARAQDVQPIATPIPPNVPNATAEEKRSVEAPLPGTAREQPVKEPAKTTSAPSRPRPAIGVPVHTAPSPVVNPATTLPEGVNERMYMEGRAVVIERIVTVEGRSETYRKVSHPWGAVNYFRDGSPVPERVWNASGATH